MLPRLLPRLLATAALLSACAGSNGDRTTLTVYSPHGSELLTHYEQAFEQANPAVDVEWIDMGSQQVLERLRGEKANPQADVWFGAPGESFDRAAREGLLESYRPTWAASVSADARGTDDAWYGTYLTPEVIAYNTDAVAAADAPRDWDDVLDPKWRGRILIRDPLPSGSMRAIFGAQIVRAVERTGSTSAGFEWLRRLDEYTKEYAPNPALLFQKLGRQEGVITLYNMPDIAIQQERGFRMDWVVPASGTPLLVDGIAIVRGTKHPEIARQFYEFVTSVPALLVASSQFTRIPARTDIPDDSLPVWVREARATIVPMALDRRMLADSLDAWMRYWDANIRNRSRR